MCSAPRANAAIVSDHDATMLILVTGVIGLLFSVYLMKAVAKVKLAIGDAGEKSSLMEKGSTKSDQAWAQTERLHELYEAIRLGGFEQ